MKKKLDKGTAITAAVIGILILIFVVGFWWGLNSVLAMEGAYPPVINEEALTPAPKTSGEALTFLQKSLDFATEKKPKVESGDSFDIDSDTVSFTNSDKVSSVFKYSVDSFDEILEGSFNSKKSDFFKGIEDTVYFPDVTSDEIDSFECNYIYYQCPSCEEISETYLDHCEKCGGVYPYNEKFYDEYTVVLHLKCQDNDIAEKCFNKRSDEEINALTKDVLAGKAVAENTTVKYNGLTLTYKVKRTTNEIVYLEYKKDMTVSADVSFTGDFEKVPAGKLTFDITESNHFDFTWPALILSESKMNIEPKNSDNLLATLICDEPTKYNVTWTSSDENIAKVDEEGYIKAGKEAGKSAIITASFKFGGKVFSDSCEITVGVPVESVAMNKRKISLNVGDEFTLSPKISPAKATDKTVTWYTEDESIATVSEDGVVTAVKPGTVTVYLLTNDGYFKSSCEVSVK